jgi:hypothetical protein
MKMVHTYRLLVLLSTAAARKASWERTLPGSRDSSTKGAALRRKAKFDVLRKKALKNGHEELAAAIDELKRRDAALTEAERENRRPKPPHGNKGFGYAHGDEGVDDDDADVRPDAPFAVEVEEDAELRRATVAARTRDDAPRGKPPARSPEYEAELEAWQTQRASHASQRQAIDDAYQDLLKRIHEASLDKRPL